MKKFIGKYFWPSICIGIFIGCIVKFFLFDVLVVKGNSMETSIHSGDKILVCKATYGLNIPFGDHLLVTWKRPRENDAVVYLINNNYIVKRIVAVEKTPLEYSYSTQYNLSVNGKTYPLTDEQYEGLKTFSQVPDGTVLAIGDNFENSIDSRNYGFIPEKNILGRVAAR